MLDRQEIPYVYREYTVDPLDIAEIKEVLSMLDVGPHQVLRRQDRVYRELGLTGEECGEELMRLMADHPTLLQRPIGIVDGKAMLGRPPEALLGLFD